MNLIILVKSHHKKFFLEWRCCFSKPANGNPSLRENFKMTFSGRFAILSRSMCVEELDKSDKTVAMHWQTLENTVLQNYVL